MAKEVTGAQRAAAFLSSLRQEDATNIVRHLDDSVIVQVIEAMAGLDPSMTAEDAIRELHRELVGSLRRQPGARVRSEAELRSMLVSTLGKEQAHTVFDKIHQNLLQERPFISMEKEPPKNIAIALEDEPDSVAALVLAHIEPSLSAGILSHLDGERALRIVQRMTQIIPPGFETLLSIAKKLSERLSEISSGPVSEDASKSLRTIAEMLAFSEPSVEQAVLEGIETSDKELAAEIRDFMFTWENLSDLDKRSMQKLLAAVDTRTLSIALKASSKALEKNIMDNLSSRVREMVADERELAGAMAMSDVEAARADIMKAVRGLLESGDIKLNRAGEDLVS